MYGQQIIRDLVLRDPETFLKLIDNKKIIKILGSIFNDSFILENIMASNSVNVKKKIQENCAYRSTLTNFRSKINNRCCSNDLLG